MENLEEVPILCHFDKLCKPEDLRPHPNNPNIHPEGQLQRLAAIIRRNGWRNPIVVSRLSGCVIKGHGRLGAALAGGFDTVPIVYQDYATPADEAADLIADNLIAEESQLDLDAVDALARQFDLEASRLGQMEPNGKFKATRDGTEGDKADAGRTRQIPVMILATEDEADRFDAVKERIGARSDEEAFSHILKGYFSREGENG